MSSESNFFHKENYQNYINNHYQKPTVKKSISDVQNAKPKDGDSDSINSIAESLNNYLDVKVCV